MMKKILPVSLLSFAGSLWAVLSAHAICPVCTLAVGAGIGLSRWLGVDDSVTGLWVGGLTVSVTMWTINWFDKKKIHFKYRSILTTLGWYALIVLPLEFMGILGHPFNKLWSVDKLLLGIFIGSIGFLVAALSYERMKKHNDGHAHFPFEKVVMPVGTLAILSAIFYFITRH